MTFDPGAGQRSEMMAVVTTVVATLNDVISALRDEVAALAENEKAGRRRLSIYLALLGVVAIASVGGVALNYKQGNDVKAVVQYVQDCQKPDGACKRRNDAVIAGAVQSISGAVFDSTSCVQALPLVERTNVAVAACREKYLGPAKK